MSERKQGDDEVGVCHICGEAFSLQEELLKHLMDRHPDAALGEGGG